MGLEHVRRDGRILIIRRYRPEARMFQNISADRLETLLNQGGDLPFWIRFPCPGGLLWGWNMSGGTGVY